MDDLGVFAILGNLQMFPNFGSGPGHCAQRAARKEQQKSKHPETAPVTEWFNGEVFFNVFSRGFSRIV